MANEQPQEFSAEFKFEVVTEVLQAEKHVAKICLELDISEAQLVLEHWENDKLLGQFGHGLARITYHYHGGRPLVSFD